MDKKSLIALAISLFVMTSAKTLLTPTFKRYGNIAYFFEDEKEFAQFFEFKKGEFVAEVGAGDGTNILDLSVLTDSITFYLQDIDTVSLSQKRFNKVIRQCRRLKKTLTNSYFRVIGSVKSTNLPDSAFDKILLVMTFHEFEYINDMLIDIHSKLKPNGKLYILEAKCQSIHHKYYTRTELIATVERCNFILEKIDGKDLNGSSGMYRAIFKKT